MIKQVRPLAAYKRANREYYDFILSIVKHDEDANSPKSKERYWYWYYGLFQNEWHEDIMPPSFFYSNENKRRNICTATEIGQLLLTAWYFDAKQYGIELCTYIHNSWQRKQQQAGRFNDLEFAKLCGHFRANFQYYQQHPNNAKLEIIKQLFPSELNEALKPMPAEIQHHYKVLAWFEDIRNAQRKKGVNYWIEKYEDLECRFFDLEKRLNEMGQPYY